ncbi:MAG: hypothetical protein NTY01_04820 [Verrucomicrobia bacterium]|nr:hypothetical protein [Verrucomicrobiota bacterium]
MLNTDKWLWVLLLIPLAGCVCGADAGFTRIEGLVREPARYANREVKIQGSVTKVAKVPMVETKIYWVRDNTEDISVRPTAEPPLAGSDVRVRGMLATTAAIGTQNLS